MTVFILTEEPYHDNSRLIGVFSTLEKAQAAQPGPWGVHDFYCDPESFWAAKVVMTLDDRDFMIREREVQ